MNSNKIPLKDKLVKKACTTIIIDAYKRILKHKVSKEEKDTLKKLIPEYLEDAASVTDFMTEVVCVMSEYKNKDPKLDLDEMKAILEEAWNSDDINLNPKEEKE